MTLSQGDASISNCRIENNEAEFADGAIRLFLPHETEIVNSIISNNSALRYGGIASYHSTPHGSVFITNCTIRANSADEIGGGIGLWYAAPTLTNCVIANNRAGEDGGGIDATGARPQILNCTIADNSAGKQGTGGAIYFSEENTATITNSIIWDNSPDEIIDRLNNSLSFAYCDIRGGYEGKGNINATPRFATKLGYPYILSAGSPCIDTALGAPDGLTWGAISTNYGRRNGPEADMGAYGGPAAVGAIGGYQARVVVSSIVSFGTAESVLGAPFPGEMGIGWADYAAQIGVNDHLKLDLGGPFLVDRPGPDLYIEEIDAEDGFSSDSYGVWVSRDQLNWTYLGVGVGDSIFDLRGRTTDARYVLIQGTDPAAEIDGLTLFTPPT